MKISNGMQKYGELLGMLLLERRISDTVEAEIFLNPDYKRDLHDPFLMKDMERACVRLYEAIDTGEKTVIYADYDCDGIPGAVILRDLFKLVGYTNYQVYIPKRNSEGYGLNLEAIKQFTLDNFRRTRSSCSLFLDKKSYELISAHKKFTK